MSFANLLLQQVTAEAEAIAAMERERGKDTRIPAIVEVQLQLL